MYRALCVVPLMALCAGLAHSFSWDLVAHDGTRLVFIDKNGREQYSRTHGIHGHKSRINYDPVQDRVLFKDKQNVYSFDINKNKTDHLKIFDSPDEQATHIAYDPTTELLFWREGFRYIYSISLKPELNKRNKKQRVILSVDTILAIAVDSCGGFIYWKTRYFIYRARYDGSEIKKVIHNVGNITSFTIDPYSQKIYFAEKMGLIKSADLNGEKIRPIIKSELNHIHHLSVSKDFIYYSEFHDITRIPKNLHGLKNKKTKILLNGLKSMAANYNIEDVIQENQKCDTLKSLLPDSTDESQHVSDVTGWCRLCHRMCKIDI